MYPALNAFPFQSGIDLNKVETSSGTGTQTPTNVLDVRNQLSQILGQYGNLASSFSNTPVNLGRVNLNTNFAGPDAFRQGLNGGIDFFGQQGISQGINNIKLQENAANNQLGQTLGRTAGNEGLIGVLQNINSQKAALGMNPLISQAQKDTADRIVQNINLQNQLVNLRNQTALQQAGFNQQSQLAELQSRLGLTQPLQNILEILSGLQGQGRGVIATEDQTLGRNFS
jgi:hypothetical protein